MTDAEKAALLQDVLENLVIGIGMGWDLSGFIQAAIDALQKTGSRVFPEQEKK